MTVPVVGNIQSDNVTSSTDLILTKPTGLSNDDLIVIVVAQDAAGTFSWPSGFTEIYQGSGAPSQVGMGACYRIVDGTEGSTFTVTNTASQQWVGWAIAISGNHATAPIDVTGTVTVEQTASPVEALSVTTTVADCLAFYSIGGDGGDMEPYGQPTGWTEQGDLGNGGSGGVSGAWGTKGMPSAAATGNASISMTSNDGTTHGQFAIAPVAGAAAIFLPIYPKQTNTLLRM